MSLGRCVSAMVLGLVLAGCGHKREEPVVAPPPPVLEESTIARYHRLYPNAIIARVVAVLPEDLLASISGVPANTFRVGDVLTFMGAEGPLTEGKVVAIVKDTIHVKFEPPAADRRMPAVGDVAVDFRAYNR